MAGQCHLQEATWPALEPHSAPHQGPEAAEPHSVCPLRAGQQGAQDPQAAGWATFHQCQVEALATKRRDQRQAVQYRLVVLEPAGHPLVDCSPLPLVEQAQVSI